MGEVILEGCGIRFKNAPKYLSCGEEYWSVMKNKLTRRYCDDCSNSLNKKKGGKDENI